MTKTKDELRLATIGDGVRALNVLVLEYLETGKIDEDSAELVTYGLSLGAGFVDNYVRSMDDFGLPVMIEISEILITKTYNNKAQSALLAIIATMKYERGDINGAIKATDDAIELSPKYKLPQSVQSVFSDPLTEREIFIDERKKMCQHILSCYEKEKVKNISEYAD